MVSLMEHLLKPLASQIFDILGAFLCVVIHLSTCPLLFLFHLHLAYPLPWSPLYLDYLQANLLD